MCQKKVFRISFKFDVYHVTRKIFKTTTSSREADERTVLIRYRSAQSPLGFLNSYLLIPID